MGALVLQKISGSHATSSSKVSFSPLPPTWLNTGKCSPIKVVLLAAMSVTVLYGCLSFGNVSLDTVNREAATNLWPRVMLFGDSITQRGFTTEGGWAAMLANSLQRRCDVISRGFSGYNTRHWLALAKLLPVSSLQGQVAVLWLGANDASTTKLQGVPLNQYRDNLKQLVAYIKGTLLIPEVILVTPPPANEAGMNTHMAVGRSGALTLQYAVACKQIAEELQLPVVDLHTAFLRQSDWQSLLVDGLHLSQRGSRLVHSLLLPVVKQRVARFMPHNMADDHRILPVLSGTYTGNMQEDIPNWIQGHPIN
uniref:Isoamyl acetate-hydrolyzing esterase 1 homolog n=1 Tax=Hirondellea gigas TaxID=1518452 RepID=A0A6A7FZ15_9CRUS